MVENIDPATFWGATGAASLVLFIIGYLMRQCSKSDLRADASEVRERSTQREMSNQTLEMTKTLKDVNSSLNINSSEHQIITDALRVLITKDEVRSAVNNAGA
jgi:hypothetical protein